MPGAFAPVSAAAVARVRALNQFPRTAFSTGLGHFPDAPGFGDTASLLTAGAEIGGATAAGGPGAGALVVIKDLASAFSSGSTRDAQRAARANYFGNLAVQGNVGAAQIILGALVPNVSGNELSMWQVWLNQLQQSAQGQATLVQAQQLGPWWPVNSTDTVTDYPIMKAHAAQWAAAHPLANLPGIPAAIASSSVLPWLIGGGLVLFLLTRKR